MQGNRRQIPSAFRPSQASATELVAGGKNIAIPPEQPLGELTQDSVKEYTRASTPSEMDQEEAALVDWAIENHRLFPPAETALFESIAATRGGGSEHDAWKIETPTVAVVIRRTINDSYGFRFSSPFQYLRRMAEFSAQVPVAAVSFLGYRRIPAATA